MIFFLFVKQTACLALNLLFSQINQAKSNFLFQNVYISLPVLAAGLGSQSPLDSNFKLILSLLFAFRLVRSVRISFHTLKRFLFCF
jgi:hypothetical protein